MTYTLIWRHTAVAGLVRLRALDPLTAKAVRAAVTELAADPFPDRSYALGSEAQRRLRVGTARIIYLVSEEDLSVEILTVGHRAP